MEITLIRHGKSTQIENKRINNKDFQMWVDKYDHSGVFEGNFYPSATLNKVQTAQLMFTSDLKRSIDSANILNENNKITIIADSLFRETELPIVSIGLPVKLKPNSWAIILRCLWFSGYSVQCESFTKAKQRANKAAKRLVQYAEKHQSVVLVGHGFFNRLIAMELKRMGWKGKRKSSVKHWGCTTYSL